jgi:hypothetical protein
MFDFFTAIWYNYTLWQGNGLDINYITDTTLLILNKCGIEKVTPKSKFNYRDFIRAILSTNNLHEAGQVLSVSQDVIYKAITRYVVNEIPGKPTGTSWKQFLLNLSNVKQCQICAQILPLSNFSTLNSSWDSKDYRCKKCKAVERENFSKNNPEYGHTHYLKNKAEYIANANKYRASKGIAQPVWASVDKIKEIYANCPEGYHVDHIYPLNSDWVCGLHVEHNLRIIPAKDNIAKSNRYIREIHT